MNEQQRIMLAIAARVLSYPSDSYHSERDDIGEGLSDLESEQMQVGLRQSIQPLYRLPLQLIREHYVQTFDLKEKTGLYLTAHELGDSRKRGMALIRLQELIREEGFVVPAGELADYMPMLYELLAVIRPGDAERELMMRLSMATERIRKHLSDDNLYRPFVTLLMETVFVKPATADYIEWERAREKPDLDPMPYPLMYR